VGGIYSIKMASSNLSASQQLDSMIMELENLLGVGPNDHPFQMDSQTDETKKKNPAKNGKTAAKKEGKREKKSKNTKPQPSSSGNEEQPDVTKLDIRVGEIVKVWNHESADKLYCEEIEVGEDAPRQIASGLRPHYTLDEMQGRRVLTICNLKAANLKGFKSHGMVLCAAKGDKVEFVDPPATAIVGERVTWTDIDPSFEPITSAQVQKKKVFEAVLPDFQTDAARVAKWKGHTMMTSAGPCLAPTCSEAPIR